MTTLSRFFESGPRGARFFVKPDPRRRLRRTAPGTEALQELERKIARLIEPAVAAAGFELVRVKMTGGRQNVLQVMAERPDKTMSADDCARLSRLLSPLLDEADPIKGAYALEVSSPGIDRPLTRLKDFADWQGYEAKIELNRMVEGRKRFRGALAGVEESNVCLDIEGEEQTALIPFDWIASARLVLTDDLIRESLKAAQGAENMESENEYADGGSQ